MASISITSPSARSRVSGTVPVTVRVDGGERVSDVRVVIGPAGYGTRPAARVRGRDYAYRWRTTRKLVDPEVDVAGDAVYWLTATAVVDGALLTAPYVPVVTDNGPAAAAAGQGAGGWRDDLAWAADYAGSLERWRRSHFATIGARYAELVDDPVLGPARRALRVVVPDGAADDDDQPNATTVRFQASSPPEIREGDELCVGFAVLLPDDFPTVHPRSDPTNPDGPEATGYVAVFQVYGPPYRQGSPFVLHADRRSPDEPLDELVVRGNELNPGDPVPLLSLPYRRGRWTDVVFRIRASSSIEDGWVETHVNQGESREVRPLPVMGGQVRVPRVLLRADSEPFRTDLQLYRVRGRFERVGIYQTRHRIAATVAEADPRSYPDGPVR